MSKAILALLVGIFVSFIMDFFLFLGMYLNYIKIYEIDVYYNILFADNQNLLYFLFSTLFYAVTLIYLDSKKIKIAILLLSSFIVILMLIPDISRGIADSTLMQKNTRLQDSKYIYKGDIYYNGRSKIYIYDTEVSKMIILDKKEIKKWNILKQ